MPIKTDATDRYLDLMKKTLTASCYPESAWQVDRKAGGSALKKLFAGGRHVV